MDRQSEAYRNMTEGDIQEELPDSTTHPPAATLDELQLPQDFDELRATPKTVSQAESRLAERIMNPSAPDETNSRGAYLRQRFEGK